MNLQGTQVAIMTQLINRYPQIPAALEQSRERCKPNRRSIAEYQAAALYALAQPYDGQPILEIGTALGYSAAVLAQACPNSSIVTLNPHIPELEKAIENLSPYGNVKVVGLSSWDYLAQISAMFGFIFVDGDHKRVRADLPWWDRLLPGGLILFHDYSPAGSYRECPPVYEALNEFTLALGKAEPDVLVVDDGGVGMAGYRKPADDPLALGKEVYRVAQAQGHSVLSYAQLDALYKLAEGVQDVAGDVAEAGAGNGGSAALLWLGARRAKRPFKRWLWLFDTFTSMPQPGEFDHPKAHNKWAGGGWCASSAAGVEATMAALKVPMDAVRITPGLFVDTLPPPAMTALAILHIDASLYDSTATALKELYPLLTSGGLLVVSAYGHWAGVRKAVNEYFGAREWETIEGINVWMRKP